MMDQKQTTSHSKGDRPVDAMDGNQGEGNRAAGRAYDEGAHRTAQSGKVPEKAQEAKRALEGEEGDELRRAEQEGKSHSHGEDPQVKR